MDSKPYTGSQVGKATSCACGGNCACNAPKSVGRDDEECAPDCGCQTNFRFRMVELTEEEAQFIHDLREKQKK